MVSPGGGVQGNREGEREGGEREGGEREGGEREGGKGRGEGRKEG